MKNPFAKRTEITLSEIRKAFKLPKDARITATILNRNPAIPIEKLTVGEAMSTPVATDPTFIAG